MTSNRHCIKIFHLRNRSQAYSSPRLVYCSSSFSYAFRFFLLHFGVVVWEGNPINFFLSLVQCSCGVLGHHWDIFKTPIDLILNGKSPLDWRFFNYHSNRINAFWSAEGERFCGTRFGNSIRFRFKSISNSRKRQKSFLGGSGVEMNTQFSLSSIRLSNYPFIK